MKAIEYFEKHKAIAMMADPDAVIAEVYKILVEFNNETVQITEKRKAVKNIAIASIIREQNQKWNALVNLFKKANIPCAVLHDGYRRFWVQKIPELAELVKRW